MLLVERDTWRMTEAQKGGKQMRITILAGFAVLLLAVQAFAGIGPGTIETSFGGSFHLSPEPWELTADMYLVYFLSETMGLGPFWEIQKTGDVETALGTCKCAWHYRLGALGKMYLPVTMAEGRMMPYVAAGVGIASLPKPDSEWEDPFEEETENKLGYFFEISFDYWMTDTWTLWAGYRGSKISGDADTYFDMAGRDMTDYQSQILIGVSHFLMK
jgi:hypothetical protein